ncbi:MAG TPA: ABC transporter ATP-binding protein, partial [Devosia sp.]|nr:ABC transporter ATP-binding protein [Devosia sp.]
MVENSAQDAFEVQDAPGAKALDVVELKKSFGSVDVLKSISVSMEKGDFLVLVGPSGCGKSTLLNCIAGLEEVSGGAVFIGGRNVTQSPPRERNIAMVFQSYALYPSMTVAQNIAFGMKVRKVPKDQSEAKTAQVAKILQIEPLLDRKPGQLSGGQRQRVAMGRALVRDPELFLFDEPLSNLDAKLRVEMRGEIRSLHQRLGASIVYVTHDQVEAMTLGTRIVVLRDGEIQQNGTPDEIYNRPANLFVADFMGSPPMNLVGAKVRVEKAKVSFDFGGGVSLVRKSVPDGLKRFDGKNIIVGIRPETLSVPKTGAGDLTLVVKNLENTGSDI